MKIAIHQPQYLPWLGYFDKMDRADVFVLLDDVQFKKNEWQNRNKIRNADRWQWLTVPVLYEFGQKLNEVRINSRENWRDKHRKGLELNYSRAGYFDGYFPFFREVFGREWELLADINIHCIEYLKEALGIKTELLKSSSLDIRTDKTQRLVDICKKLGADTYLSGAGGADYLDLEMFRKNGIKLEFQEYSHPEYRQMFEGFEPYMAVVDLLFCQGKKSLDIIREGRKQ
ncbi:MAG: WbqC family protein [Candidatus Omnitrophota bacterium]|nr:WbqC family protein [Candidatus Omnitrophota bacterium]